MRGYFPTRQQPQAILRRHELLSIASIVANPITKLSTICPSRHNISSRSTRSTTRRFPLDGTPSNWLFPNSKSWSIGSNVLSLCSIAATSRIWAKSPVRMILIPSTRYWNCNNRLLYYIVLRLRLSYRTNKNTNCHPKGEAVRLMDLIVCILDSVRCNPKTRQSLSTFSVSTFLCPLSFFRLSLTSFRSPSWGVGSVWMFMYSNFFKNKDEIIFRIVTTIVQKNALSMGKKPNDSFWYTKSYCILIRYVSSNVFIKPLLIA